MFFFFRETKRNDDAVHNPFNNHRGDEPRATMGSSYLRGNLISPRHAHAVRAQPHFPITFRAFHERHTHKKKSSMTERRQTTERLTTKTDRAAEPPPSPRLPPKRKKRKKHAPNIKRRRYATLERPASRRLVSGLCNASTKNCTIGRVVLHRCYAREGSDSGGRLHNRAKKSGQRTPMSTRLDSVGSGWR